MNGTVSDRRNGGAGAINARWRMHTRQVEAPTQRPPGGGAIDPGHDVWVTRLVIVVEREEFMQVGKASMLDHDPGIGDTLQLDFDPSDQPGQTQPADRGPEPFDILLRPAKQPCTIRTQQFESADLFAETASDMVILAMHIVGDGAAQGNEASPGRHR